MHFKGITQKDHLSLEKDKKPDEIIARDLLFCVHCSGVYKGNFFYQDGHLWHSLDR